MTNLFYFCENGNVAGIYTKMLDLFYFPSTHFRIQVSNQSQTMVLQEFLLTHGPQEFVQEFQCDVEIIEELRGFTHIDEKGKC